MKGKVWLVGAGPGDVGLFTIKGQEVLKNADVVVYDSLVGESILTRIPETARCIYVGKRAGNHAMAQEEINRLLLAEALKGNRVVRLKGGDPFLFGRGGEELELLREQDIPYEIVPGVTSPLAVPAYNGIPVTHREFSSSVHIVTGHKKAGVEYDIDFEALVRTGGTLVFLMGAAALEYICSALLKAGMDPEMPAGVFSKGTTAGQRSIVGTISDLKEKADRQGVDTPAIIVVGRVCALADAFRWYEKLPLAGCRILLTRPRGRMSRTAQLLREKGAEVVEAPTICTRAYKEQTALKEAFGRLSQVQWLVFTSPTGVEIFFDACMQHQVDIRVLGNMKIAAIGDGTRKALLERGLFADLVPEIYDAECLGESLAGRLCASDTVMIPRASRGNPVLVQKLQAAGAQVWDIPIYETVYEKNAFVDIPGEFEAGQFMCAVFTSASTVKGFAQAAPELDYTCVKAACIGKQTKAAAEELGMQAFMAKKATIESLVQLVEEMKEGV